MASPPKQTKQAADADDLQIPIQKTSPLVFVGIGVAVLALGGLAFFMTRGGEEPKPDGALEAAVHSARMTADEAKAKREAQLEHLELAAKAWAVASEQERVKAAASAAAAAAAEEANPPVAVAGGGKTPDTTGAAAPPPKKKASNSDLDQLDKLGSAVNSELGGP
jgi:hypothetical protein